MRERVMVAVHDTLREVTTITVDRNEMGDTVKTSIVTDRERVRNRDAIAKQRTKLEVRRDTVYVERRDSVFVEKARGKTPAENRRAPWLEGLKWVFWIIVAIGVLIVIIKVSRVFRV